MAPMLFVVNELIRTGKGYGKTHDNYVDPNLVSDGYHTFGELYEHRISLFMIVCKALLSKNTSFFEVWRSKKHYDGSEMEGWFIMGIFKTPGLQISYHLPISKWDETNFPGMQTLDNAPEWDGHTSKDVLDRLKNFH